MRRHKKFSIHAVVAIVSWSFHPCHELQIYPTRMRLIYMKTVFFSRLFFRHVIICGLACILNRNTNNIVQSHQSMAALIFQCCNFNAFEMPNVNRKCLIVNLWICILLLCDESIERASSLFGHEQRCTGSIAVCRRSNLNSWIVNERSILR